MANVTVDDLPSAVLPLTRATTLIEVETTEAGEQVSRKVTAADLLSAVQTYTRNAAIVEDRTLLASASATTLNNNNVLAALIADLQTAGIIQ